MPLSNFLRIAPVMTTIPVPSKVKLLGSGTAVGVLATIVPGPRNRCRQVTVIESKRGSRYR